MKAFEYGDWEIGTKEIFFAVASMAIGVGLLSMPREVDLVTFSSDGWISVLIGGLVAMLFTYVCAKLAARFPRQTFYSYGTRIVSRPVAFILTLILTIHFILICAIEVRVISNVAKLYIFFKTPMEVISLVFLLVVIYATCGSSVGILRLNMMFLPFILVIVVLVQILNVTTFNVGNIQPMFVTPPKRILSGSVSAFTSFAGFEILLFYIALMNRPKTGPKAAALGMIIPIILGLFIYVFSIAIFSVTTREILYPTVEMAKEIYSSLGFFERIESLFFTIWIMTIFNTAIMAFDVSVIAIKSLFPKFKKVHWVILFSPIIYLVAMFPQSYQGISQLGKIATLMSAVVGILMPTILLVIAMLRGVKGEAKGRTHKKD